MRKTTKLAAAAFVASTGFAYADTGSLQMDMNVGALSPTCSFSNPIDGAMVYDEANNQFLSAGVPGYIDAYIRSMRRIFVVPDSALSDGTAIADATWGTGGAKFVGSNNFQDNTENPSYDNAAVTALDPLAEYTETIEMNPQNFVVDGSFNP